MAEADRLQQKLLQQQESVNNLNTHEEAGVHSCSALQFVFSHLSEHDLLCNIPFVCKSWQAAAADVYGNHPMVRTSFQVEGGAKTASLALWIQRHGRNLLQLDLIGFKHGVTAEWWTSIFSAPLSKVQHLALRSCGAPDVPLHLLPSSAPCLKTLKLEHAPCAPAAPAIANMTQLTNLVMRRCQLSLQHLNAVGKLSQLVVLGLPGNSFLLEQATHSAARHSAAAVPETVRDSSGLELNGIRDSLRHSNSREPPKPGSMGDGSNNRSSLEVRSSEAARAVLAQQQHEQQHELTDKISRYGATIGNWVTALQRLQELDLSDCNLQERLLDQLPVLTTLTKLQLSRASLDAKPGAAEAASAMNAATTQLRRLSITADGGVYSQHVLMVGAGVAASCAVIGRMPQLLELDVSNVQNACEQLCLGMRSAGGPLALRKVNVSCTACTEEQMQQLMSCCPNLKQINADGNEALCSVGGCYI